MTGASVTLTRYIIRFPVKFMTVLSSVWYPYSRAVQFLKACEKWGRDDLDHISQEVETKPAEAVRAYAKVFWKRYSEIPNHEQMIRRRSTVSV